MLKKPLRYPVTITRRRVRIVTCKLLIMVKRNKYVPMYITTRIVNLICMQVSMFIVCDSTTERVGICIFVRAFC